MAKAKNNKLSRIKQSRRSVNSKYSTTAKGEDFKTFVVESLYKQMVGKEESIYSENGDVLITVPFNRFSGKLSELKEVTKKMLQIHEIYKIDEHTHQGITLFPDIEII